MATRRSALGRGLGALIQNASTPALAPASATPGDSEAPSGSGVREIPIDRIEPNPDQPRRVFAREQLESLTDSIRLHGVLQPVVVRSSPTRPGYYELIVGERRWRAARAAGKAAIAAVVSDRDSSELLELAIVENVQRHDLNPMELAHAYRALADRGATQEEIGEQVSQSRSSIANHVRLLELSRDFQGDVEEGRLSLGHAKALLQVQNPERRRHLRDRIVRDALSVREAERLAREESPTKAVRKPPRADSTAVYGELAESLQRRYQTRVRVTGSDRAGRIEIEYSGPEDLQRISELLLGGG